VVQRTHFSPVRYSKKFLNRQCGFWSNPVLHCRCLIPWIRYVTNFCSTKGSG
jgi:hypothetical protein